MNIYKLALFFLSLAILFFGIGDSIVAKMLLIPYYYRFGLGILVLFLIFSIFNNRIKIHWLHVIFFLLILLMSIRGYRDYSFMYENFQPDLFLYLGLCCFMVLGFNLKIGLILDWLYMLLLAGIVINIIGIIVEPTFLRIESDFVDSIAYKYHSILFLSLTLIFLPSYFSDEKYKVILLGIFLVILEVFLFQKRAYLARVSLMLAITWLVFNYATIYRSKVQIKKLKKIILLSFVLIFPLVGLLGRNYVSATLDRLSSSGSVNETLKNDARFDIGEELLEVATRSPESTLFGVGLGTGVELEAGGLRRHSEMGIATIMYKGGLVLLIFWGLVGLIILFNSRKYFSSELTIAFFVTVLIWYLFLYVEGYFSAYQNPMSYLIPFAMGVLLRIKDDKNLQLK